MFNVRLAYSLEHIYSILWIFFQLNVVRAGLPVLCLAWLTAVPFIRLLQTGKSSSGIGNTVRLAYSLVMNFRCKFVLVFMCTIRSRLTRFKEKTENENSSASVFCPLTIFSWKMQNVAAQILDSL
jgi:hypothetical protein